MASELTLILGPMFAGKSTYLINKANNLINCGVEQDEILLINHSSDVRYDTNKICSHNGQKINSKSINNLANITNQILDGNNNINISNNSYRKLKYIFIDEAQFFNDLYESIKTLLMQNANGLHIFIGGLDSDYKQEPFYNSHILELIPYAFNVIKLNAKCFKCDNKAPFTKRITAASETILVGGSDVYQPTCILHLHN
jgi:thymidine kinase